MTYAGDPDCFTAFSHLSAYSTDAFYVGLLTRIRHVEAGMVHYKLDMGSALDTLRSVGFGQDQMIPFLFGYRYMDHMWHNEMEDETDHIGHLEPWLIGYIERVNAMFSTGYSVERVKGSLLRICAHYTIYRKIMCEHRDKENAEAARQQDKLEEEVDSKLRKA